MCGLRNFGSASSDTLYGFRFYGSLPTRKIAAKTDDIHTDCGIRGFSNIIAVDTNYCMILIVPGS